jgi:hypothetical protein
MKNAVFWDVTQCSLLTLVPHSRIFSSTLKMEAIRASETAVYTISTWTHIPEDGILWIVMFISSVRRHFILQICWQIGVSQFMNVVN